MAAKEPQARAVPPDFLSDPGAWLSGRAHADMDLLLAHADDGVIWGRVADGRLKLAGEVHAAVRVKLDAQTLWQARLFGPAGELFIWRVEEGQFLYRQIEDGAAPPGDVVDDHQWLWGTRPRSAEAEAGGFTLLVEGRQGLRHAPPIVGLDPDDRVRLNVRHYVRYDQDGRAYIADSRLTGLQKA